MLRVSPNATTSANLLITGEINVASIVGRDVERLAGEKGLVRVDMMLFGSDGVLYSQVAGWVTVDKRIRLALSHAIDTAAFNRAFTFGLGAPMDTLTTPSMQCFDPAAGSAHPKFDPARAQAPLQEAGYKRNAQGLFERDGQTLKPRIAGNRTQNAGPEYLLEAWRAVGVDATLTMAEFNTWLETLTRAADWDVTVMPYNSVFPTPSLFVAQLTGAASPAGSSFMGVENPAYAAATAEALAAGPEQRCAQWARAERIILESGDSKALVARNVSTFSRDVQPPRYDWGRRLVEGVQNFYATPVGAVAPAVMIAMAGLALGFFGEAVARALNPLLWTRDPGAAPPAAPAARNRLAAFPHQFSGGMQQRAMIALGLMTTPALLIADEPTTALDVTIQAQVIDLLRDINARHGTAILLITHSIGVVAAIARRVVVMYAGAIVEDGPVATVLERPAHPYSRLLMAAMPAPGEPRAGRAFAPRCPDATARCRTEPPARRTVAPGQDAACQLAEAT